MSEPQTLSAAFFGATVVLSGVIVHLYRANQKLHAENKESQGQMLRVLVVVEKALEQFTEDSQEVREAVMLMKDRQATILKAINPSADKSQRNLPR